MLPFTSRGWYFRGAAAFLLDRGKISWADITFVVNASDHLKSDAFAPAIAAVQDAFAIIPTRPKQTPLSKHSSNAAVGAMHNFGSVRELVLCLKPERGGRIKAHACRDAV